MHPRIFVSLKDRFLFNAVETLLVVLRLFELEKHFLVIFEVGVICQNLPEIQTSFLCQCIYLEQLAFLLFCLDFVPLLAFEVAEKPSHRGDVLLQDSRKEFFVAPVSAWKLLENFKQVKFRNHVVVCRVVKVEGDLKQELLLSQDLAHLNDVLVFVDVRWKVQQVLELVCNFRAILVGKNPQKSLLI